MNKWFFAFVCVVIVGAGSVCEGAYQTDKKGAMVITKARISEADQGEVLGDFWDSVDFGRKVTELEKGVFTIDPNNRSGSWVLTVVGSNSYHSLDSSGRKAFLGRMQELVGKDKLTDKFSFFDLPKALSSYELNSPNRWFLLDKERNAVSELPAGSMEVDVADEIEQHIAQTKRVTGGKSIDMVEESVLVELGELEDIREKFESYQDSRAGGAAIYRAHFERLPLRMEVYESRTGVAEGDERVVGSLSGFDARFHHRERSGAIVIPRDNGETVKVALCNVRQKEGGGYQMSISAEAILTELIVPNMEPTEKLKFARPAKGREEVTAFRIDDSDACGPEVIHAEFTKDNTINLVMEPSSGDPTLQYRVEIQQELPARN